jgi:hypothetical protein
MTESEWKHEDENYGRELDRREELEREDVILHDPVAFALNCWLDAQNIALLREEAA